MNEGVASILLSSYCSIIRNSSPKLILIVTSGILFALTGVWVVFLIWLNPSSSAALRDAIKRNEVETVAQLVIRDPKLVEADIASPVGSKVTPLMLAVGLGKPEICRTLVQYGAKINARDIYGLTALHRASRNGDVALVSLLMAAGADTAATSNDGRRPADYAQNDAVKRLLVSP